LVEGPVVKGPVVKGSALRARPARRVVHVLQRYARRAHSVSALPSWRGGPR